MIILLHITIAITSMMAVTFLYLSPSDFKFKVNYVLTGATLASGTYLVVDRSSHLVESCLIGLIYLAAVSFALIASKRKFVRSESSITER